MNLPININDLLTARTVEWERLEFKAGWNPEVVLHTMCAFANDFHNLGGGYIVIGVGERNGSPVLPPQGIPANQIDKIQKEILNLGHRSSRFTILLLSRPCISVKILSYCGALVVRHVLIKRRFYCQKQINVLRITFAKPPILLLQKRKMKKNCFLLPRLSLLMTG